jgi:hypothetical protein
LPQSDDGKFSTFQGVLFRADGTNADALRGIYAGGSCFLVCGGPSINALDLNLVRQRGILLAAVNNVAATHVRPHLWFAADKQTQFSETIWRDPGIAKFVKAKYLDRKGQGKGQIRRWSPETQTYVGTGLHPSQCPNVWGYDHWKGWDPETFLDDPRPSWGVSNADQDPEHRGPFLSVLLVAVWMLYWLGVRRIYLVGADFHMSGKSPYAFDQAYEPAQVGRNNSLYGWLNRRFREVRPHFERRDLQVRNTNRKSKLDAFDFVDYDQALAEVLTEFPAGGRVAGHYAG